MCLVRWRCLPLWFTAALAASVPMNTGEMDSEESRRVLGSSVVTSVSVITDHGNGTKQYYADAAGKPVTKPTGAMVGSPGNLLAPDRYEFYTFDESGDLVKSLMTLDQIQGLIAGSDNDAMDSDATAPIYYHEPLPPFETHVPATEIEPLLDLQGVHNVVASVQNVLKSQLEASKSRFPVTKPLAILSVPDAASSWSILVPGVMGSANASDLVRENASSTNKPLVKVTTAATTLPPATTKIPVGSTHHATVTDKVTEPSPPIIHYLPIHNIPKPHKRPQHPTTTTVTVPVFRPSTVSYSNSLQENTASLPTTVKSTLVQTTAISKPVFTSANSVVGDAKPSTLSNSVESSTQDSVPSKIAEVVPDMRPISNEMAASFSNVISQMTDEMTTKIVDANYIPVDNGKFSTHQTINRLTSVPTVTATMSSHRKPNPDRITYIPVQVLTNSPKPTKIVSKPSSSKINATTSSIHESTTKSSIKSSTVSATAVKVSTTPLPIKTNTLKDSNSVNKVIPAITTQNPIKINHSLVSTGHVTLPQKPNGIINHDLSQNYEAFGTHNVEIVRPDSFPSTLMPATISSVISSSESQLITTPAAVHTEGIYSLNAEQRTPTPQLSSASTLSIETLKPYTTKPQEVSESPLKTNTTKIIYPEKQSATKPQVKPSAVSNVQNHYTKLTTLKPQPISTNVIKSPGKNYTSATQLPNKSNPNKHNSTLSVSNTNKNNTKFKNNITSNGNKPTYSPSKLNGTDHIKGSESSYSKPNNSSKTKVKPILNNSTPASGLKLTSTPPSTDQTTNVAENITNPTVSGGPSKSGTFTYSNNLDPIKVLTPSTSSVSADSIGPLKSSSKLTSPLTTTASIITSNIDSIKTIGALFPSTTVASGGENNTEYLKASNTNVVPSVNESIVQVGGVKPIKSSNKVEAPTKTMPSIPTPEIYYTSGVTTTLNPIKMSELNAFNNGITERFPSSHITSLASGFTEQMKTSNTKNFTTGAPTPVGDAIQSTVNNKVKVLSTTETSMEPSDKKPLLTNNKTDVLSGTKMSALASDKLNSSHKAEIPSTTTVFLAASHKKPLKPSNKWEITLTSGPSLSMANENPLANMSKVEVPSSTKTSTSASNTLPFQTSNKVENPSPTGASIAASIETLKTSNKVESPSATGPSIVPSNLSTLKTSNKIETESVKGASLETQLQTLGIPLTTDASTDTSKSSVNTNVSLTNPSTHVSSTLPGLQANSAQSTVGYTIVDTTEYKVTQRPDTKSTNSTPTHASVTTAVMNELESSLLEITTEYEDKSNKLANEGDFVKEGISAVANLLLQEKQPTAILPPPKMNGFLNSPAVGEIKHATTSDFSAEDVTETDNNEEHTPSEKGNNTVQEGYGVSGEDMPTSTINYLSISNDTNIRPLLVNTAHSTTDNSSHEITPSSTINSIQKSTQEHFEQTVAVTEPAAMVNTTDIKTEDNDGTTDKVDPASTIRHTNVKNSSQIMPPKESKLSPDGIKQKVGGETKNEGPLNINVSMSEVDHFEAGIAQKNNMVNESNNFSTMLPKPVNTSLQSNNTPGPFNELKGSEDKTLVNESTSSIDELIEQKAAPKPIGVSSKKPGVNNYRPHQTDQALQPPTAVELHPAPYESMGLETSIAFLGEDVRRFSDLCNELGFRMWTSITGKGQIASRSLVLSPFAAVSMLAMVFLGARGPTSGQMNDLLKLDDMVTFNPHQVMQNITESVIRSRNHGAATAAFVRELYSDKLKGKLLDFYKERVQQYYDGHVEEVSFNVIGDILRRRTNLLVKRQTLGKVPEYLRGSSLILRPPLAAFTANIYQTECDEASTEGRDGEMYFVVRPSTRQRRLVPVPAAVWQSGFLAGYEPGLDATAVCLGAEAVVSTVLVLPGQQGQVAPGDGLARLEQRLLETSYRRGVWSRLLRSLLPRPGLELQLPRFSHRSVLNVTSALHKMGLGDLLTRGRADLRGLNGLSTELHLSDVLQVNTFSTCSEEAPGARHHVETYPVSPQRMARDDVPISNDLLSPPSLPLALRPRQARLPDNPRLRFDRPFLYLVRHNPTGMVLHIGRFNPRLLP